MPPSAGQPRIPRRALFVIATLFGLSSTLQSVLLLRINSEPSGPGDWIQLLVLNLAYWYVPALLAPVIMSIAVALPAWPHQLVDADCACTCSGVLLYSLHTHAGDVRAARRARVGVQHAESPEPDFWSVAGGEYIKQLDWQLMTYLFLVGLAHALAFRRESERRALDVGAARDTARRGAAAGAAAAAASAFPVQHA